MMGGGKMFFNVEVSYTGYRNNCGANSTPTQATYTVPAAKYMSKTSQADADALAQADINANAQNHINANASCIPYTLHAVRPFTGAGIYNWISPVTGTVDAFVVGGGSGGLDQYGGGGGYAKTFLSIPVTQGQSIQIIIGQGGIGGYWDDYNSEFIPATGGGFSQFMNPSYRAEGGVAPLYGNYGGEGGGSGGSGGGDSSYRNGGTDGSNSWLNGPAYSSGTWGGKGQGTTTRDFGEPSGQLNAGGGRGLSPGLPGTSDSSVYGKGGDATGDYFSGSNGNPGTCLIRYYGP